MDAASAAAEVEDCTTVERHLRAALQVVTCEEFPDIREACILRDLATFYSHHQQCSAAESLLERAVTLWEEILELGHTGIEACYAELGRLHYAGRIFADTDLSSVMAEDDDMSCE